VVTVSATQLRELISGCRRKWAWRYIARRKVPESRSAALGIAVHRVLAELLRGRSDAVEAVLWESNRLLERPMQQEACAIVRSSQDLVIALRPHVEAGFIEREIHASLIAGVDLVGVVDLVTNRDGRRTVWDHKTVASDRYAMSEEALRVDVQLGVYAHLLESVGVAAHEACWDYYLTRGQIGARWEVRTTIDREATQAVISSVTREAAWVLQQIENRVEPRDMPAAPDVCRAYGGCPYRALCAARPSLQDLEQIKERQMSETQEQTLLEKLRARKLEVENAVAAAAEKEAALGMPTSSCTTVEQNKLPLVEARDDQPQAACALLIDLKSVNAPRPVSAVEAKSETVETPQVLRTRRGRPPKIVTRDAPEENHTCVVYVDCVPSVPCVSLDTLFAAACSEVAADSQVAHWQLVPFGGGAPRLALAVRRMLAESPPMGCYITSGLSRLYQAVEAELLQYAMIVRGVR
jgi:hypothetical protein